MAEGRTKRKRGACGGGRWLLKACSVFSKPARRRAGLLVFFMELVAARQGRGKHYSQIWPEGKIVDRHCRYQKQLSLF